MQCNTKSDLDQHFLIHKEEQTEKRAATAAEPLLTLTSSEKAASVSLLHPFPHCRAEVALLLICQASTAAVPASQLGVLEREAGGRAGGEG